MRRHRGTSSLYRRSRRGESGPTGSISGGDLVMDAFILACLALRRSVEEKHIPEPEFQPFRLEYLYPVNVNHDEQSTLAFNQFSEGATV
jgi:hypothetical protein